MYERNDKSWLKHIDFFIVDLIAIVAAYLFAFMTRFPGEGLPFTQALYRDYLLVLAISEVFGSIITNNTSGILKRETLAEFVKVITLDAVLISVSSLILFGTHAAIEYSRLLTLYTGIYFVIVDLILRLIWKHIVVKYKLFTRRRIPRSMIIVSDLASAQHLIDDVKGYELSSIEIKGLVLTNSDKKEVGGIPVVSSFEDAADYVCREWVDEIMVSENVRGEKYAQFLDACTQMGVTLHAVLPIKTTGNNAQFVEKLGNQTVITTAFSNIESWQAFIKRTGDILGGLIGCLFTLLIGIFVGPAIYFASPGPIIFKQKRIGKNGKPFYLYKFRSMYLDAEERKKELMKDNVVSDGMMFKMDFDPRIIGNKILPDGTKKTGIGDFIRKTSLDEFPQFWNVLKGDMSLVGTRPPTEDEWAKYKYHHKSRMATKPGITGVWQTSGRNEVTDFEEVIQMDTEYITNFSIALDIKLLFKTIWVVLARKGVK